MILSERAADEVSLVLSEDDFYRPAHRDIFLAIRQLQLGRRSVDLVTVKNELQERGSLENVGGSDYLIHLIESVVTPSNASHYAGIVSDKSALRKLERAGQEIIQTVHSTQLGTDEKVQLAEAKVFEVGRQRLGKDLEPVRALAKEFFKDVDLLQETGTPMLGTPTKFVDLDKVTGGMYGGEMTIVAARPGMGKTSLVLNFALNVAKHSPQKGNVAVFSLEMSGTQLIRRMLSMLSGVGMGALKKSRLSDEEYHSLADACETLYSLPIYIDDTSDISTMEMRGKCRRLKADGGLSLVVVDYLQLMRASRKTESRQQEISEIARGLKAMSKEFDVPVVALSQLNRGVEGRESKRPMLSDLRESGSIEAEADLVMLIYRDSYYADKEVQVEEIQDDFRVEESEIIIAKHRNGPTTTVTLGFQPTFARFVNLRQ